MKKVGSIKNKDTNDFNAVGNLRVKVGPRLGNVLRELIEGKLIAGATVAMANETKMAVQFVAGDPLAASNEEDGSFVNGFSGDGGFLVTVGSTIGSVLVQLGNDFLLTSASLAMIDETTVLLHLNIGEVGVELVETEKPSEEVR